MPKEVEESQDSAQALVLRVPATARIPEGATFWEGEDDGKCRLVRADGTRCPASRVKAVGLCPGHSGVGGIAKDPRGASKLAHAERAKRKSARLTLGVSARRAATPLQAARVAAQRRADDYARAIVDAPLDEEQISVLSRQKAAIEALNLLFPQTTATLEVTMPEDEAGVEALSWAEMQRLAARLLDEE